MPSWNAGWQHTSWPGIYQRDGALRIRVRLVDPRSGRLREKNRIVEGAIPGDAPSEREALRQSLARDVSLVCKW